MPHPEDGNLREVVKCLRDALAEPDDIDYIKTNLCIILTHIYWIDQRRRILSDYKEVLRGLMAEHCPETYEESRATRRR